MAPRMKGKQDKARLKAFEMCYYKIKTRIRVSKKEVLRHENKTRSLVRVIENKKDRMLGHIVTIKYVELKKLVK